MDEQQHKPTRSEIRSKLLGAQVKPKSEVINIFGTDVEVRQPPLKEILDAREENDVLKRTMRMFIQYTFVPGTDEHVFEDTDLDVVMNWPFGEDIVAFQQTITQLTGVDIANAEQDLKQDPTQGQS